MDKISHLLLWWLVLSLLCFTGLRTLHFLSLTFPPDQAYMPWLGLAAFDGGVLLWLGYARSAAKGWQRPISYLMIAVCMGGVIICTWADTFLVASKNGLVQLPIGMADQALRGVLGVILANVIAGVVIHLVSPEHLRQWVLETAQDKINAEALKQIQQRSVEITPDVASQLSDQWKKETYNMLLLKGPPGDGKKKAVENEQISE